MQENRHSVMCFGDSNTHGTMPMENLDEQRRYHAEDRWAGVLSVALGQRWHLIEEGHPGRTTVHDDPLAGKHRNGLRILPALLETHRPLDLVVLMLGTNDLKTRFAVTPFDIAESIGCLAEVIKQSKCGPDQSAPEILLVAPPPILEAGILAETYSGGAAKSASLSDRIAEVSTRLGTGFFDAGKFISSDPLDGIHFSGDAHRMLGNALAAHLAPIVQDIEDRHG